MPTFPEAELEAYLDEALPPERMAAIERAARGEPALVERLATICGRRDAGVHSLGEIWRAARVSCPSREQLGSYLLGALSDAEADYVSFHLKQIGCTCCRANLADLESRQNESDADEAVQARRERYFQSSAGYLKKR